MHKHFFSLSLICLIGMSAFAQKDTASYLTKQQVKINLNFLGASVSYEPRLSSSNTLYFEAGTEYGFAYTYSSVRGSDYRYSLSPTVSVAGRHYYHFKERLANGKNIANNASNYWFLQARYNFKPISHTDGYNFTDAISVMPGWGIQRNIGQRFSLELQLGIDFRYYSPDKDFDVLPGTQFKIGYRL